ncbi:MAG TPA: hypothetical protein VHF50_08140 [Solirubrobacterales bacterium]|nr:hypothetical protein [Solirubrobacterales bacterium]
MRRFALTSTVLALAALALAPGAWAAFGFKHQDVTFAADESGTPETQAGAHPYSVTTTIELNTVVDPDEGEVPDEAAKDIVAKLPAGLVGTPKPVEYCSSADFLDIQNESLPACPDETAIGANVVRAKLPGSDNQAWIASPVYNLQPPPGVAAKFGFIAFSAPTTVEVRVNPKYPHNMIATASNIVQVALLYRTKLTLWGNPASEDHDALRGSCLKAGFVASDELESAGDCPVDIPEIPFLTLPRSCQGPQRTLFEADSWQRPGAWATAESATALETTGCSELDFEPTISAKPTSAATSSGSGLDFSLDVDDPELMSPADDALAESDVRKAVVTLPEGFSANPSVATGLGVCTIAQFDAETPFSAPGQGCPLASKIGTVEVETPLLDESLSGSVFVAKPYENLSGNSLLALYVVVKNPTLGIVVKQPLRVEPDARTGQLRTIAADIPQLPFSHFRLQLHGGPRSPLVTPPTCGPRAMTAELFPWSGGPPVTSTSTFEIVSGPNGAPCPTGGAAPFRPGFEAGTVDSTAGAFSPFSMRMTRNDGEQEMTRISAVLPPGLLAKLAGVPFCPEAAIAAARARTGSHGAREELDSPSCPAASRIGRSVAGAGVGPELTYVPGSLYLAGPVGDDPLSVVAITPAMAGPFDAGVVVVREAVTVNPVTGEAEIDGSTSDPIPHILKGIPLNLRDLRLYVDRPRFTLNATNCAPSAVRATLFGSFLSPLDPSDDVPVDLSSRYQASSCASLGFKPRLSFRLRGRTERGGHPALRAVLRPRAGDANLRSVTVRLPRSAFLEQAHIRTVCTRVQWAADACPKGAIYGRARAFTPLLDEPLRGPVYLRSSDNDLPDLVLDLHGLVDIEASARIDSIRGGIRARFSSIPDAPVTKVIVNMRGKGKGLIVNSRDLCRRIEGVGKPRAGLGMRGQNGRALRVRTPVRAKCRERGQDKR